MLKNLGNRQERRGQSREDLEGNRDELMEKIPLILESETKQFWVRERKATAAELQIVPDFDDNLPVIQSISFAGLEQKFQTMFKETTKNNTQRLKTSTVEGSGLQIPAGKKLTVFGKKSNNAVRKEGFLKATIKIKNK